MKKQDSTIVLLKYLKRETEEQDSEHGLRQLVFAADRCNGIWRYRHVTLINIIGESWLVLQPINIFDEYDGIELKTWCSVAMIWSIFICLTDLKKTD